MRNNLHETEEEKAVRNEADVIWKKKKNLNKHTNKNH